MKTLITPEQVVTLAFGDGEYVAPDAVRETDIAAAEHRYIRPIVGGQLCEALAEGRYAALLDDYVAPALAMAVRTMLQRAINVCTGQAGLVVADSEGAKAAPTAAADTLQRSLVRRRRALVRRLSEHLCSERESYPEYNPAEDAAQHCSIDGNIIQVY